MLLSAAVAALSVILAYLATLLPSLHSKLQPRVAVLIFVAVGLISVALTTVKESTSRAEDDIGEHEPSSSSSPSATTPDSISPTTTSARVTTTTPPTTSYTNSPTTVPPPTSDRPSEKYLKDTKVSGDWNPHPDLTMNGQTYPASFAKSCSLSESNPLVFSVGDYSTLTVTLGVSSTNGQPEVQENIGCLVTVESYGSPIWSQMIYPNEPSHVTIDLNEATQITIHLELEKPRDGYPSSGTYEFGFGGGILRS